MRVPISSNLAEPCVRILIMHLSATSEIKEERSVALNLVCLYGSKELNKRRRKRTNLRSRN